MSEYKNTVCGSLIIAAVFLFSGIAAQAEVFMSWPFKSGAGGLAQEAQAVLPELASLKIISSEPVIVNGINTTFTTGFLALSPDELAGRLARLPKGSWRLNKDTFFLRFKAGKKQEKRIILINTGSRQRLLAMIMTLPVKLPATFPWPRSLPLPSGGVPLKHISFPKRKVEYGCFKTPDTPGVMLQEVGSKLLGSGWQPFTGEAGSRRHGRGELFINPKTSSLMSVGFSGGCGYLVLSRKGTVK